MTREQWIDKFKLFLSLMPDVDECSATDRLICERACIASFEAGYDAAQSLKAQERTSASAHEALSEAFKAGAYSHIVDAEDASNGPDWPDTVGE